VGMIMTFTFSGVPLRNKFSKFEISTKKSCLSHPGYYIITNNEQMLFFILVLKLFTVRSLQYNLTMNKCYSSYKY
jgi:hypothetical protein